MSPIVALRGHGILPGSAFTSLGSAVASGTSTTQALTLTAAINPGDMVFVASCSAAVSSLTFTAITNSGTVETWTFDKTQNNTSGAVTGIALHRCTAANTHAIGQTITVTSSSHLDAIIFAFKVSPENFFPPVTLLTSNSNAGTSTSATPGSSTPVVAPTFGVLVVCVPTSTGITTPPTGGWTQRLNLGSTIGDCQMYVGTIVKADKNAVNNATGLNPSTQWAAFQCFYALAQAPYSLSGPSAVVSVGATR